MPRAENAELVQLARRASDGDDRALEDLLTELHPPIMRFLRGRLRDPYAAEFTEDIALETLVRISRKIETCRASVDAQLMAWVLTIARNLATDWARSKYLRYGEVICASELGAVAGLVSYRAYGDAGGNGQHPAADRILMELVKAAHAALSADLQGLIWLRLVEGAPWKEVGREVGTTESGAKRRYQRAQKRLRKDVLRRVASLPEPDRSRVRSRLRTYGAEVATVSDQR